MGFFATLLDLFVHLDTHLAAVIAAFGGWTYALMFLILFAETGFVFTPFLPGDSMIFAAGAFAARGSLDLPLLFVLFVTAPILGDMVNYWVGRSLGPRVFRGDDGFFFRKEYLDKTHAFFEEHGPMAVVLARFIPIIRTFTPFVAGIGRMAYGKFTAYNVGGAFLWTSLFLVGGYAFGNLPFVRDNFEYAILGILLLSFVPMISRGVRGIRRKTSKKA